MSDINNQVLISLLKQYGIKKLVLSSGARNIPFVTAVETDDYFECYSVIDERSAAFFGLGLSQQSNEPVALACTSGTAASNYLTGVTEAYYSNAPLVVITFDRGPYSLNQLETQKIDQMSIFESVCKKNVSLPLIKDSDDLWYSQRLINEALIELRRDYEGPVHINVPLVGGQNELVDASLSYRKSDAAVKIEYVSATDEKKWETMFGRLCSENEILFVAGQISNISEKTKANISSFLEKANIPVLMDNLSNFKCSRMISAEGVIKALNAGTFTPFMPKIVITFGCNFQERIKDLFKAHRGEFEHWSIEPGGNVKDVFKSQRALFDCTFDFFFEKMLSLSNTAVPDCSSYLKEWKELENLICLPEMPFGNFAVIREFVKVIPRDSILHTAILNSTRLMQFFSLDNSVKSYSNVNSFGIDGCLPTFMGQAFATDKPAFLVIGDLSFFYGMNALAIKHRKNNIRILLINNGGGAEFHIMPDSNAITTIDRHIGAAHNRVAKGWIESMGYDYLTADSFETLDTALRDFVSPEHSNPVVLEVFTHMKPDGENTLSVYRELEKCIRPLTEK